MADITDTTIGTDTGEQLDMFGRLHTVVIKGKAEIKQGDLFQYGKDKINIKGECKMTQLNVWYSRLPKEEKQELECRNSFIDTVRVRKVHKYKYEVIVDRKMMDAFGRAYFITRVWDEYTLREQAIKAIAVDKQSMINCGYLS